MSALQQAFSMASGRLPKVLSPSLHAAADDGIAVTFLIAGIWFWKRSKRAALGSLFCGAATATNALLTDYPGGAFRVLSYKTHGEIDAGLAGITASLPRVMGFGQDPAAHFFKVQALGETAVTVMTDFGYYERSHTERSRAGLFRPASTAAHHDETA